MHPEKDIGLRAKFLPLSIMAWLEKDRLNGLAKSSILSSPNHVLLTHRASHGCHPMKYRVRPGPIYAVAAVAITALWTYRAKTENQDNKFASIVAIADGSAPQPFVKRRLLCDAARVAARLLPARSWQRISRAIDASPVGVRQIRGRLGWRSADDPLLISATVLIGLSAVGFMYTMRGLIFQLYEAPRWLADGAGLFLGLSLLGGGGDIRFGFYPYDLPNAFVFALTLAAILARSFWLLPAFAVACYSKETSVLLIPAYLLARQGWPDRRAIATAAVMGLVYLGVRRTIDATYGAGTGGFWFPGRNARWLAWALVFDAWWYLPVAVVSVVRIARYWSAFPTPLRCLVVLVPVLLALAFFKGWIEEKRQYLELIPILGPLLIQWVVLELGMGHLLRAKEGATKSAAGDSEVRGRVASAG